MCTDTTQWHLQWVTVVVVFLFSTDAIELHDYEVTSLLTHGTYLSPTIPKLIVG